MITVKVKYQRGTKKKVFEKVVTVPKLSKMKMAQEVKCSEPNIGNWEIVKEGK